MKVWSWIILVVLAQLGGMNDKARATTFDVPLNGEIEITGDITSRHGLYFRRCQLESLQSTSRRAARLLLKRAGYSILRSLNQTDPAAFRRLRFATSNGSCFLLSNFLGCGGSLGCSETTPEGYGYLRNGTPAPILISEAASIFSIATYASADVASDLALDVDLPDGLGIEVLPGRTLNAAKFASSAATTPSPAALPLFATGLIVLGLVGWRSKGGKLADAGNPHP